MRYSGIKTISHINNESTDSTQDLVFNVNGAQFTMKYVEGGCFMMGSTDNDYEAYSNEKPAHKVKLDTYYIGETQVTQELWQAVMGYNPSKFKGDKLPVERVSWYDCQEFINKLNIITGKTFALPTEAQWEFAARGGGKCKGYKFSGSDYLDEVAWCSNNSNDKTHQVATKKSNELGLYDISGNVFEWCNDWFHSNYYSNSPEENPKGSSVIYSRVIRGGSFCHRTECSRVSYRGSTDPHESCSTMGLRLVLNLKENGVQKNNQHNKVAEKSQSNLVFDVRGVKFTMKYVEGATFKMGISDFDTEFCVEEHPQHLVQLDSFYIGETLVTNELWEAVMGRYHDYSDGGDTHPVHCISWDDCQMFIRILNRITGRKFVLPTEAQWEYAARGGIRSQEYKYSGSNNLDEVAWYRENSNEDIHKVAMKKPNELGLYDMTGNLFEWCSDIYKENRHWDSITLNPQGPSTGNCRVLRGANCTAEKRYCRISYRSRLIPSSRYRYNGFRIVLLP